MQVEDAGELMRFETKPKEGTLYLTAVRYVGGMWMGGPSGMDKADVMRMLDSWHGIDAARIYAVPVPIGHLPAA